MQAQRLAYIVHGLYLIFKVKFGRIRIWVLDKGGDDVESHFAEFGELVKAFHFLLYRFVYVDFGRHFGQVFALELDYCAVLFLFRFLLINSSPSFLNQFKMFHNHLLFSHFVEPNPRGHEH